MKMNFKLLTLALAIPALNVQAVSFSSVKESANKAIVSGKQKLNEAGKWVSAHKKEVAISAASAAIVTATGLYIIKLRKDLGLKDSDVSGLKSQLAELSQSNYDKQVYIEKIGEQLPVIKNAAANNHILRFKTTDKLKEVMEENVQLRNFVKNLREIVVGLYTIPNLRYHSANSDAYKKAQALMDSGIFDVK